MVTVIPPASKVPPLFIPTAASCPPGRRRPSQRLISCMHGQAGRSRDASAIASPMWSKWPCETSRRSQRWIESAVAGLFGLAKNGSKTIVFPPGVRTSNAECPYHVNVVSRSSAMRRTSGSMLHRGYTRPVSATQIAENLAFINWTVLTGLALGSFAAVVLLARRTAATSGYLRFTTICALAFGALAWNSDGALPTSLGSSPVVVDPVWGAPRRAALLMCVVLVAAAVVIGGRLGASALSVIRGGARAAAVAPLLFGALAWGVGSFGAGKLLVQ